MTTQRGFRATRYCQRTVARALKMDRPPDENRRLPRASLIDPWKPKIDAIIFDNLKSAVVNGSGRNAHLHREFMALCGHFCLEPIACA